MNCYQHPDAPAVAYCRSCGRALCAVCQRPAEGTVFCPEHAPVEAAGVGGGFGAAAAAAANPYTAPPPPPSATNAIPNAMRTSPALAFCLGCIPGVGAIYNGQYVKGLVHALIFGLLMSLLNTGHDGEPFLVMTTMAFFFYMAFEAYHTARKRQLGLPLDEWSSLLGSNRFAHPFPVGPIALILVGILFLLQSLNLLDLRQVGRFWPVILIVIGVVMLYMRLRRPALPYPQYVPASANPADVSGERP